MKITVLAVGRLKENFYTAAVQEYLKRLSRYCKIEIIEVADEKTPDSASPADEIIIKNKEGERLLHFIKDTSYVIVLAIEGKMLSSTELAANIAKIAVNGTGHITFVIGGSLGLSSEVIKRADFLLSFSKMTFPHQLMRVILLEQLYRSYRINTNEPYHK